MLKAIISLLIIFVFLVIVELIWRKKKLPNEASRQIIHIGVATFVAFWPYYMSYKTIFYCAIAFLVVILFGRFTKYTSLKNLPDSLQYKFIDRQIKFIESIHKIGRVSWGDVIFPVTIGLLALFSPDKYIFTIAMLNVGFADGLASYIGLKFSRANMYKVFDQPKSALGTITFIIVSFLILLVMKVSAPGVTASLPWASLIYLPLILALTENFAVYGTDDFMIPIMTLVVLSWI